MEASGSRGAYGGGGVGDDHGYDWHSHESAAPHSHGGGGHDHGGVPCGGHGHDHGMGGEEFDAEQRHWNDVLRAFREYSRWMEYELRRRDAHLAKLPPRLAAMLPPWSAAKGTAVRGAVAKNQQLLTMIAEAQADSGFGADGFAADEEKEKGGAGTAADVDASSAPSAASASVAPAAAAASAAPLPVVTSSAAHFSKVKSTLHQLVRDWSDEGKTERDACYAPVMAELKARLPVTAANRNQQRVCIPGCGTGRFVFDCALEGYAAQGCEFSFFMLFASHVILNCTEARHSYTIHPWAHDPSNHLRFEDMVRAVPIPDINPTVLADRNPGADFSMAAGDFEGIYSAPSQAGMWDAVATCFFIDTAPVVLTYIETIWRMLKPGGVWVNHGPLLYHWQSAGGVDVSDEDAADDRYGRSLELTYSEVKHAIQYQGFEVVKEAMHRCTYASNKHSLMATVFTTVLFTAMKPVVGTATTSASTSAAVDDDDGTAGIMAGGSAAGKSAGGSKKKGKAKK